MLAIDTETTGLFIHKGCKPFIVSACDGENTFLWRFKVNPHNREVIVKESIVKDILNRISQHKKILFHNANFDLQALDAIGISSEYLHSNHCIEDTMVMSHALYSKGPHGLKELAVMLMEMPEDDEDELGKITKEAQKLAANRNWCIADKHKLHPSLVGLTKQLWKSDYWIPEQIAEELDYPSDHPFYHVCRTYAVNDVIRTYGIYEIMMKMMTLKQRMSYFKARKLIIPILRMEYERIPVLEGELSNTIQHYELRKVKSQRKLARLSNIHDFNPDSPKQLKEILFNKYKFTPKVFTNGGEPSTNKDQLAYLLKNCPTEAYINLEPKYQFLINLNLWRKEDTTLQYAYNYRKHTINGHIQSTYKQTATGTNRLSSENPNATNVGKSDMSNPFAQSITFQVEGIEEESFKLRNLFGPKKGTRWICIDYQQFQLLIFAIVSNSKELIKSFADGRDIHNTVAEVIFQKNNISSVERTAAKAINFGLLFGAGPAKIEKMAGMPGLYNLFLSNFPNAKKFLSTCEQEAKRKGYVHTVGGYRLYVPYDRSYAASCYVIQGTEAEIVRDAMVDISTYTYETKPSCPFRMIMMVHDELVFRTKNKKINHKELNHIIHLMENAGKKLGIPCKVDADIVVDKWSNKLPYLGPAADGIDTLVEYNKTPTLLSTL